MGKDLKGKELGTELKQKSNGLYSARYADKFGNRKEIYDNCLAELKRKLNTALYDDAKGSKYCILREKCHKCVFFSIIFYLLLGEYI